MRPLSDEEKAENWRKCRQYLRRYMLAALAGVLLLFWAMGYAKGLLDGYQEGLAARRQTKESN